MCVGEEERDGLLTLRRSYIFQLISDSINISKCKIILHLHHLDLWDRLNLQHGA